jgi:hypothetical protein
LRDGADHHVAVVHAPALLRDVGIDPEHPSRKRTITRDEWAASGPAREPDPALYSYDARNRRWVLKEGV